MNQPSKVGTIILHRRLYHSLRPFSFLFSFSPFSTQLYSSSSSFSSFSTSSSPSSSFSTSSLSSSSTRKKTGRLILVRHGQSIWNVTDENLGTTARFTGWTDVPLTPRGYQQAIAAGKALQRYLEKDSLDRNYTMHHPAIHETLPKSPPLDAAFCSLLSRSRDTMTLCLQQLNLVLTTDHGSTPSLSSSEETNKNKNNNKKKNHYESIHWNSTFLVPTLQTKLAPSLQYVPNVDTTTTDNNNKNNNNYNNENKNKFQSIPNVKYKIPVISSWRLNERHYGALVGLSKEGAERLYGKTQLRAWRDGWDVAPPPMEIRQWNKWKGLKHTRPVTVVQDPGSRIVTPNKDPITPMTTPITIGYGEEEEEDVVPLHVPSITPTLAPTPTPTLPTSPYLQPTQTQTHSSLDTQNRHMTSTSTSTSITIDTIHTIHSTSTTITNTTSTTTNTTTMEESSTPREFTIYEYHTHAQPKHKSSTPSHTLSKYDPDRKFHTDHPMPTTESLSDTCERILPLWISGIAPRLRQGHTLLLVAHANTIRSLLYHIDPQVVTQSTMKQVKIPSAVPLIYHFQSVLDQKEEEEETKKEERKEERKKVIVPGNLLLLRRSRDDVTLHNTIPRVEGKKKEDDLGKYLNGEWIETEEIQNLSFCSKTGISNLEHEIA